MATHAPPIGDYARLGALLRLKTLAAEMKAIRRTFPDLRFQNRTEAFLKRMLPSAALAPAAVAHAEAGAPATPRRKRRLTPAQRKAISERMTKTWAERRRRKAS